MNEEHKFDIAEIKTSSLNQNLTSSMPGDLSHRQILISPKLTTLTWNLNGCDKKDQTLKNQSKPSCTALITKLHERERERGRESECSSLQGMNEWEFWWNEKNMNQNGGAYVVADLLGWESLFKRLMGERDGKHLKKA